MHSKMVSFAEPTNIQGTVVINMMRFGIRLTTNFAATTLERSTPQSNRDCIARLLALIEFCIVGITFALVCRHLSSRTTILDLIQNMLAIARVILLHVCAVLAFSASTAFACQRSRHQTRLGANGMSSSPPMLAAPAGATGAAGVGVLVMSGIVVGVVGAFVSCQPLLPLDSQRPR